MSLYNTTSAATAGTGIATGNLPDPACYNGGVSGFVQRYQTLMAQRDTSNNLIKDVILHCEELRQDKARQAQEMDMAKLDLEDAVNSRRELQKRLDQCLKELQRVTDSHEYSKNRNPYIVVLIDGDGLIFQEKYVRQRVDGGKHAAYELRSIVAKISSEYSQDTNISAKVVANVGGLAHAMVCDGALDSADDLKAFTLGFTQAMASFDFIDVGWGKERADAKVRENTRWHLQNQNCKQVLLGVSHDSGYAPFLDEILRDDAARRRVAIIEGVPTVRELVATRVEILKPGNDLFRPSKLCTGSSAPADRTMAPSAREAPPASSSERAQVITPASSMQSSPQSCYSAIAAMPKAASPPPKITVPLPPRPTKADSRQKTWSPGPRGFDKPTTCSSREAMDSVKGRQSDDRLCNNYFLRGACDWGDACRFTHKYKPTADEIAALAVLARQIPCALGQECADEDCIGGHHCPNMRGDRCASQFCKFPVEAHPPGTRFSNPIISENAWR